MTGLEKITSKIIDDARVNAMAAKEDAKKKASQIIAEAQKECQDIAAREDALTQSMVQSAASRAKSGASLGSRQALLAAKQKIIARVIDCAKDSLLRMDDAEYFGLLLRMVKKFALPGEGRLLMSQKDLARAPWDFAERLIEAAKPMDAHLVLSDETRAIDGGFVLDYDGVEENCSFEAIFYARREALQDKVQAFLFR